MQLTGTKHPAFILSAALLLSSCASMSNGNSDETELSETTPVTEAAPEIPQEALTGESLFQLLLAEIATNRREFGAAAALYTEIGDNYNDVEALQRGVILNQTIENYEQMYLVASKWQALRPADPTALSAYSLAAIATGRLDKGISALTDWLAIDPDADAQILLPAFSRISGEQRAVMFSGLDDLQKAYPDNATLYYVRARLNYGNTESALALTDSALELEPTLETALYKFQLLQDLERSEEARFLIEQLRGQHPENRQIAILYARYIYQNDSGNLDSLASLHTEFPTDPAIARTYARAAFDQGKLDTSSAVFSHLLELGGFNDEAHYFLGRIDIANEQPLSAADHFAQVKMAPYLISAMAEWISIGQTSDEERVLSSIEQAKSNDPEQASTYWRFQASYLQLINKLELSWQTLGDALQLFPDDVDLLYDRAMMASSFDQPEEMEESLIRILELDPDNMNALNALGYTWADLSKNLSTAHEYIDRALSQNLENPAFQDSKGWILYRLGQLEEALVWLKKAYSNFRNDEVAAHITEVQWKLNQQDEARATLAEIRRLFPESKYIEYLEKLLNE